MNRIVCTSLCLAALAAPTLLAAQAPAPFSAIPSDAEVFARLDFQAMSQAPGLSDMIQWYKGTDPNFQNLLFQIEGVDQRLRNVMTLQAGETMVYEFGATFNPEKMDESEFYVVTYGRYNPAAIFQAATAQGFAKGPDVAGKSTLTDADGTFVFTMANDWTLAFASTPFALGNILATTEDPARTLRSDESLAGLMGAAAGSFFTMGSRMEGGVRKAAADLAAAPPAEAMMIPGALPVLKGLETIRSAGYAFTPTAHVAQVEYATPEAATAGASNLTMMIKGLAALAATQVGADPAAQAQIQAMQNVNLVAQGTRVGFTQPITPDGLRTMAQQFQMAMPMMIQGYNAAKAQAQQGS